MILGFSEDFTSNIVLDAELKSVPTSGLYVNSGVHPSITLGNLLDFLPKIDIVFEDWDLTKTYSDFMSSKDRTNIVMLEGVLYQSISNTNLNQNPATETLYLLKTNIESLRLKMFLLQVQDRVLSDLSLTKRLVNNQYLYENGKTLKTLDGSYCGWVLEPKGSDYVSIRVNEISIQKDGTDPVNVYVLNNDKLLETITVTPDEGRVAFRDTNITLNGKGIFKILIDSTDVYTGTATIDPLKFDGFLAYTTVGSGATPETSTYDYSTFGNGIGLNVTAFLDATNYIEENLSDLGNFVRAAFEYMVFQVYLHNSNNRSNRSQRIQMSDELLLGELKRMDVDTVLRRYYNQKKKAMRAMQKTFDTQLNNHNGIEIKYSSL